MMEGEGWVEVKESTGGINGNGKYQNNNKIIKRHTGKNEGRMS